MRKLIAILMILALCCAGCAMAEATETAKGLKMQTQIEDGSFIIRVESDGDLGWVADDMAQDDSVVKLQSAETVDGDFVARYDATGDGDVTVGLRHYIGIACDQASTWDLHVENGAVTEVTGGSQTMAPNDEDFEPVLVGEWLEVETQFTEMTVEKNPERGFDVEIASPLTHGAYIFKTTVYYDCDLDAFVYDKGKFWEVPITDSEEEAELGEAKVAGTTGRIALVEDDGALKLEWYDSERPDESVLMEKFDAEAAAEAETAGDVTYVCPDGELTFNYDPNSFVISTEDFTDDEDMIVLSFADESWGEGYVRIYLHELADGEAFMDEGDIALVEETFKTTVEKLDTWGNFTNVYTYTYAYEDGTEDTLFAAAVYDAEDGEEEYGLNVTINAMPLEDEATGMARSDAISNIVDSLQVLDD